MAGGRLLVENEYDQKAQVMTSEPAWRSPDGSTLIRSDGPEVVRLYRREEMEMMMREAGLEPRRLRRAMARTWVQDDRQMQTTWVARPCS
jgi:hypothetical protein